MGRELAMEAVLLGWVVTANTLPTAAFLLAAGRLADIYGRKRIFLYGSIITTISSFFCAFASSGIWLIIWRALQGVGGAMAHTNAIAILTSVFPPEERGRALGIALSFTYLGASVGPFLGGVLTQQLDWRSIFLLVGFLNLIVIGLIFWKLKGEWAESKGEKFDFTGSIVFGISLLVLMYGFTVLLTAPGMVLVALGILGLLVFVWLETRMSSPLLNVGLFRKNTIFVFSNLATLVNYSAAMAVIFLLTLYLQYNRGFSPQTAGSIMLVQSVCMTITAPIAGRLSDRVRPQIIAAIGLALNCAVFLFFYFLTEETALGFIMTALAFLGIGWGLFSSPNSNAVMGSVDIKFLGVASATLGTMRSVGMVLSMAIAMILFSIYIGEAEITPEYYPAFLASAKMGFMIFTIICFSGIFAQLAGIKASVEVKAAR
jgi:MFS family permease